MNGALLGLLHTRMILQLILNKTYDPTSIENI